MMNEQQQQTTPNQNMQLERENFKITPGLSEQGPAAESPVSAAAQGSTGIGTAAGFTRKTW